MATEKHPEQLASVRAVVESFLNAVDRRALVLYSERDDLLFLTDFSATLVTYSGSSLMSRARLSVISDFLRIRKELPGVHVLAPSYTPDQPGDITGRSEWSDQSSQALDLLGLTMAQKQHGPLDRRYVAVSARNGAQGVKLLGFDRSREIPVWHRFSDIIVSESVTACSGVYDAEYEPTRSWGHLRWWEKGLLFLATETTFGMVFPHAKTNESSSGYGD